MTKLNRSLFVIVSIFFILMLVGIVSASFDWNLGGFSYYDFNQNSGTILPSVNTNIANYALMNGTLINSPNWTSGIIGNALYFNYTTSQYVDFSNEPIMRLIGNYSITGWFNQSQTPTNRQVIIHKGQGNGQSNYDVGLNDSGYLYTEMETTTDVNGGGCSGAVTVMGPKITPKTWNFFAISFNTLTQNLSLYLNGNYVNSSITQNPYPCYNWGAAGGPRTAEIGARLYVSRDFYFNGTIDEIGIFNKTLDSSNILSIYNNGVGLPFGQTDAYFFYLNIVYNNTAYETSNQSYSVNISQINGYNISSVKFYYNGVSYTPSLISSGNNWSLYSINWQTPIVSSSSAYTFYWNVTASNGISTINSMSSNYIQTVLPIIFTLCNATYNVPYLNFTAIDEISLAYTNSTLSPFSINYWLGNGSTFLTYSYSNSTLPAGIGNYSFCFSPSNQTLYTNYSLSYTNTNYGLRNLIGNPVLTNTTTITPLWMLSTTNGFLQLVRAIDQNTNSIIGANIIVTRTINNNVQIITTCTTDSSGSCLLWLNPSYTYNVAVTYPVCTPVTINMVPGSSGVNIQLTCSQTGNVTLPPQYSGSSSNLQGVTYTRSPSNGIIYFNSSQTWQIVNYTYVVADTKGRITGAALYLFNDSSQGNSIVNYQNISCGPYNCSLSMQINQSLGEDMWGSYYVNLGQGLILLESAGHWSTISNQGSWISSVKNILNETQGLFNINWQMQNGAWVQVSAQDQVNKREFSRYLIFFFVMAIILILVARFTSIDFSNPGFLFILVAAVVVLLSADNGINGPGYFYLDNFISSSIPGYQIVNNWIFAFTAGVAAFGIVMQILVNRRL